MRRIIDLCQKTGVNCKTIPSIGELINDKVSISKIRDVSYADLMGRSQVDLDMNLIGEYLKGKCVLVTGAGGSIGSEFCRQVAAFKPKTLIMLDRAESNLYDIEMELRDCYPRQRLAPILGSVTTATFIRGVFNQFKPHVVFHAAAYKHVPMMEIYPWEAMYNNILGTKNVLEAALEVKAERFVLISTDKAVRPTNVMGASKRVAEILLQLKHKETMARLRKGKGIGDSGKATRIMAVRFGNVIGSAGSVIPLFKRQIAQGGPVNVTHPDVTRFFMTIGEAVQLVLQAGAMGESGEIYILKMGRPVKILDMARDLIRLSGFEPDKDIRINITGLRPGEKLYEELITEGEGIVPTAHEKLMVLRSDGTGAENGMSYRDMEERIEELLTLARKCDRRGIQLKLWEIVPEYKPQLLGDDMPVQDEQTAEARKCMAVKM
jgi:FlaA1/EpsC-like NDP-sugar epimerase